MASSRNARPRTPRRRAEPGSGAGASRAPGRAALATGSALALAAAVGVLLAAWMPRGPITVTQAMVGMTLGLALGTAGGALMRSRWSMLLVPVVVLAAFEVGRLGTVGPSVGRVELGTSFGILALLVGRGVFAVLCLGPIAVGATLGVGLARRPGGRGDGRVRPGRAGRLRRAVGWGFTAAAVVGYGWLAVLILRPASTPPILGPDGAALPGSVASLEPVMLGGQEQWILVRGQSVDNPVLLYLAGGPGQSDLPYARVLLQDLEQDFVVVGWDQRGAGKSYPALDPTETLTPDRAVADTAELTNVLRERFGEEKIYLLGESWGSTLAVLAAQSHPELYYAVVGSGQMVSQLETDRRLYDDVLAYAERTGEAGLARRMRGYGPPPYGDMYAYGEVMGLYEVLGEPYTPPQAYVERGTSAAIGPMGLLASEYSLIERPSVLRGLLDMFSVLYPQIQDVDFRRDVPTLEVPLYILDGQHELKARRDLALEWFEQVQAPIKRLYTFVAGGHSVAFENFEALHRVLVDTVLPETYPGSSLAAE